MDLPNIPEIFLTMFLFYVCFSCLFKRVKMSWNWTFISDDSLLWAAVLNLHRFHDVTLDLMRRKNGTHLWRGKWAGSTDYIATVDPANIHYLTTINYLNYTKDDKYRKIFDIMGYGVFNSEGEDWKRYRRITHTIIKNRDYVNYSNKMAHAMLDQVLVPLLRYVSDDDDRVLDMQDVFQRFTLDVVFKSLTGYDQGSLNIDFPKVPFIGALADFEWGVVYRIVLPEVLWKLQLLIGLGPESKLSYARKVIRGYISDVVIRKRRDVITRYGKGNEDSNDVDDEGSADALTLLMKEFMKDGATETQINNNDNEELLQDLALQFLIAARDTASSAMTWFIWLIATHPRVEEKIREEIRETIIIPEAKSEKFQVFNCEETNKLTYLHAALYESLRLYPPAPFQYKKSRQADVLPSGHKIYPNMKLVISLYWMARMKSIWGDNCSEFVPERWISNRGTINHEPANKYFVFNAGPRSCLGKDTAMTQMKMFAATLVHNFRFEVVDGQDISPNVSLILHVKGGLKVKVHNRWP